MSSFFFIFYSKITYKNFIYIYFRIHYLIFCLADCVKLNFVHKNGDLRCVISSQEMTNIVHPIHPYSLYPRARVNSRSKLHTAMTSRRYRHPV